MALQLAWIQHFIFLRNAPDGSAELLGEFAVATLLVTSMICRYRMWRNRFQRRRCCTDTSKQQCQHQTT